ncbi:MAG: hypothetical protein ACI4EI_02865 [Muricoprocola sp.]
MMDKLRKKLSDAMQGRNGMDDLSRVLFMISFIVYIISILFRNSFLQLLSMVGLIYTMYRALSRDLRSRQEENQKYLQFLNLQKMRFEMRKEYRIFKCKGCGRNIRVPKGKGKVEITCPLCGRKEIHRT